MSLRFAFIHTACTCSSCSSVQLNEETPNYADDTQMYVMFSIGFPAHFRQKVNQFYKMCIQFRPGHFGMCECSFQFRLLSINFVKSPFIFVICVPIFVNCKSNSSVTVAGQDKAESISSIGIHFRQNFNQNRHSDIQCN